MIGGMAGVSFLLHYALGWNFGLVFVLVNLPFYWIAVRRMGWEFTLKTFLAVGACGLLTDLLPRWGGWAHMTPAFAAVVGGALCGLGILFFIRHRASLGGVGILAVYLQRDHGISAMPSTSPATANHHPASASMLSTDDVATSSPTAMAITPRAAAMRSKRWRVTGSLRWWSSRA